MFSDKQIARIIKSKDSWIEGDAVRQLQQTSALDGIVDCVGLPDIHPGKYGPVGAAFLADGIIYPTLIGNDVGCGIGLFSTHLKKTKIKTDKWVKQLTGIDRPYDGNLEKWQLQYGVETNPNDASLGIIGGGNHFVELQSVERVIDATTLDALGLDRNRLVILAHTGSRSIGDTLFRRHTDRFGAKGLDADTIEARHYLDAHDNALKWAACNRALVAHRFGSCIRAKCAHVLDVCHNSVMRKTKDEKDLWLHRKGAASTEKGLVVIPGSRGSLSYLVKSKDDQAINLWSLPHGAGRKWRRGTCKDRLRDRYPAKSLVRTALGSRVICEDKDLLYEEAPQAYKNIEDVLTDLIEANLIEVVASFKPLITYKMRKS